MNADKEFMVFNKSFERIGIFKNPRSLSWVEYYQNIGKVQIIADNDEAGDNSKLLQEGNILWRKGTETAMEIQSVETNMDETLLVIGGMSTTCIFTSRRPFGEEFQVVNVERDLYAAINASMTGKRAEPDFETAPVSGLTETFETVISGESLGQIVSLTQQTGLGFKTIFDPHNKKHIFKIYKGVDRTYGNSDAPVIFSNDIGFRNLSSVKIFRDKSLYKNTAIVRGQTEGGKTAEVIIGDENVGADRYELYVDGTGVERTAAEIRVWNDNSELVTVSIPQKIDDPDYLRRLRALGETELKKHQPVETFEAEILAGDNRKWDIGDIVTVKWVRISGRGQIRKTELIKNIRIMSLEFIIEDGFCKHKITIGNPAIDIFREMELKG